MAVRQTFLSLPAANGKRHLFIVIAQKELDCLVVPIESWQEKHSWQDDSCILGIGDHPFIKHKSWVNFARARNVSSVVLCKGILSGDFIRKEDIDTTVLERIICGAKHSDRLSRKFLDFFI